MKSYEIRCQMGNTFSIEAETEDEAREKALELFRKDNGGISVTTEYVNDLMVIGHCECCGNIILEDEKYGMSQGEFYVCLDCTGVGDIDYE